MLKDGGSVTNGATGGTAGLIEGHFDGVETGGAGTVTNTGTIIGTFSNGVYLGNGGTVVNKAGLIEGGFRGVRIVGAAGTVTNFATILGTSGNGVALYNGGGVVNTAGLIEGGRDGVYLAAGGDVSNGASGAGTALVTGVDFGVEIKGSSGTVSSFGTIEATGSLVDGVYLATGGRVSNGASGAGTALITAAGYGVEINGSSGTVANFGSIEGTGSFGVGVYLVAGGSVTNGASGASIGLITGGDWGVKIGAAGMTAGSGGTLVNFGTIEATGGINQGAYLPLGGSVINGASSATTALIEGDFGVDIARNAGTGTVANFGTIEGISGSRGLFVGGTAGLVTNGASGSSAALIEGGVGLSLVGSGATVTNFGTISGTDGIAISLGAGDDRVVIEAGSVLQGAVTNFQPGDTFDLPFLSFSSSGTVTLGANNVLQIVESGGTFTIGTRSDAEFRWRFLPSRERREQRHARH